MMFVGGQIQKLTPSLETRCTKIDFLIRNNLSLFDILENIRNIRKILLKRLEKAILMQRPRQTIANSATSKSTWQGGMPCD